MADTSMKVDTETRDRFARIAKERGMSVRAYLAELAIEEENQFHLRRATAVFHEVTHAPGIAEAFDAEFGTPPTVTRAGRAA